MAKAGFWLRGAKGKLAGASMGKGANGQTIMREIVTPKNPKTNAQLMQRAIMATVMQAYSAGKAIFDHSFQGKSVGAQNQQRFMSINARLLRAIITNDIDNAVDVASQQGRVVAPGVPGPVPALLQVSEGTLINSLLPGGVLTAALANEKLGEYCARLGLNASDLFTFVALVKPDGASTLFAVQGDDTVYSKQFGCQFVYARYQVKASALTSETLMSAAKLSDIIELTESNFTPLAITGIVPEGDAKITDIVDADAKGSFAWIRSRFDEGLRSTESMVFDGDLFGITSSFALAAWKQGASSLGDSDLILEGGNF